MAEEKKNLKDLTLKDIANECREHDWEYEIYETGDGRFAISYFPHNMVQAEAIADTEDGEVTEAYEHYVTMNGIETIRTI